MPSLKFIEISQFYPTTRVRGKNSSTTPAIKFRKPGQGGPLKNNIISL